METPDTPTITLHSLREFFGVLAAMSHKDSMSIEDWMTYVDRIEKDAVQSNAELIDLETEHSFAGGIYCRTVFIKPGQFIISNIHNTEHHFAILEGDVAVRTHDGTRYYNAPYQGITKPMTRRILFSQKGCKWATFHAMERADETVPEIMERILFKRVNPLLSVTEIARIKEKVLTTNLLK